MKPIASKQLHLAVGDARVNDTSLVNWIRSESGWSRTTLAARPTCWPPAAPKKRGRRKSSARPLSMPLSVARIADSSMLHSPTGHIANVRGHRVEWRRRRHAKSCPCPRYRPVSPLGGKRFLVPVGQGALTCRSRWLQGVAQVRRNPRGTSAGSSEFAGQPLCPVPCGHDRGHRLHCGLWQVRRSISP